MSRFRERLAELQAHPVLVHEPVVKLPSGALGYRMTDTWRRPVYSGPEERWPESDPRYYDRACPEPCDDANAVDGCRLRWGHMGVHSPTPEVVRLLAGENL